MKKIKEKAEAILDFGGTKKDIALLVISGIALVLSLLKLDFLPFDLSWVAILLCGIPIVCEAIIGLVTEFDIKADVLVAMALIASVCIKEDFAAGEIAFIMQLGGLLEDLTVAKAQAGIERLVKLTPQQARIITPDSEKIVPADDVKIGDTIKVLPGETIAVDGVIISGETSVNQSVMTGESVPVDKKTGDSVSSGTVNQFGAFEMRAEKVGEDSSIQRMIKLIKSADANKAKIVGLADRWATWIVITALTAAGITWAVSGEIIRAVTILVVFCPCSLVLATPTAIMAAIGNATKHGFLVRQGDALERLSAVTTVTFDKTGTLTYGKLKVTAVKSCNEKYSDDDLYKYVASAESNSEHPLGKAIINSYSDDLLPVEEFKISIGKGVSALVDGKRVFVGKYDALNDNANTDSVDLESAERYCRQGATVIYAAIDNEAIGYVVLKDVLRDDSRKMITALKSLGVSPVLLTGDNNLAAKYAAEEAGVDSVYANCLPEEKLDVINKIKYDNRHVCMIGDGINDAPALKTADVGIAMGGIGSDIAIDAADIVLVEDDIKELPHLISLSKKMMKKIKFNLSFSMTLNIVAIILAITGVLNPVVGALVHNAGSVFVIINSSLLLKKGGKNNDN